MNPARDAAGVAPFLLWIAGMLINRSVTFNTPSFRSVARRPTIAAAVAIILIVALSDNVDAQTKRYRRANPVRVALEPFLAARAVVHAVADPLIAPIVRRSPAQRGEPIYDAEEVGEFEEPAPRALRVAYIAPQRSAPLPPRERFEDEETDTDDLRDFSLDDEDESAAARLAGGDRPTVAGRQAVLRNGIAYAPSRAPQAVKNAIWAANKLRGKPYVWGGGHGSFYDRGYDCSGTVSFALHGAGALSRPMPSSGFASYGERGRGRWITVYARRGHVFAVIAGLRLDTTDFLNGGNTGPRWHADMRDTRGYVARHPAGM